MKLLEITEETEVRVTRTSDINRALAKMSMTDEIEIYGEQVWFSGGSDKQQEYDDQVHITVRKAMKKYTGHAGNLGGSHITGGCLFGKNRLDKLKLLLDTLGRFFDSDPHSDPGLWPWVITISEADPLV